MDKKTIPLIILLVLVIIFFWPALEYLGLYKPTQRQEATSPTPTDTTKQIAADTATHQLAPVAAGVREPAAAATAIDTIPVSIDTVAIETENYRLLMSTAGGGPLSLILKNYTLRDGTPIQMLPEPKAATPEVSFGDGTFLASSKHYQCNLAPGTYVVKDQPLTASYSYAGPSGGLLTKQYVFYPDKYHYDLIIKLDGREHFGFERQYQLTWNTPLGITEPQADQDYMAMEAVAMMAGGRETLNDYNDGILNQSLAGYTRWVGLRQKYFAAVLIPHSREAEEAFAHGTKQKVAGVEKTIEQRRITAGLEMTFAGVSSFSDSFTVFVGPLDYTLMAGYKVDLEDMLGIGTTPWVGWIIKPFALGIIWLLPRMYDVLPNYGVVIIVFALLIKIVTLPLSLKSFKSMQAMRELAPQLEELKKQYKKDAQALNRETMKLYKKAGVNPMSGCFPLLAQMPLLFALFSVFRSTILLRNAPFAWFITDLSRGASGVTDPYIILVILMVLAQFVSQKFTTPSTGQNKLIGYFMPVFFGFLFFRFAAGLVIYWTCFSLFSLLDYAIFRRKRNLQVKTL